MRSPGKQPMDELVLRPAALADVRILARQRRAMFEAMRLLDPAEGEELVVVQRTGIRRPLETPGPKDTALPTSQQASGSRWSDSNRRPAAYEAAALPLSYIGVRGIKRATRPTRGNDTRPLRGSASSKPGTST